MAGGNTIDGDTKGTMVYHPDGSMEEGLEINLIRGDVIVVPRTFLNSLVGRLSILQMTAYMFSIYMSYLAATAYL